MIGVEPISMMNNRWCAHADCKDDADWGKRCMTMKVDRTKPRECLIKRWCNVARKKTKNYGCSQQDAPIINKKHRK